jgi:hypothetical protein
MPFYQLLKSGRLAPLAGKNQVPVTLLAVNCCHVLVNPYRLVKSKTLEFVSDSHGISDDVIIASAHRNLLIGRPRAMRVANRSAFIS